MSARLLLAALAAALSIGAAHAQYGAGAYSRPPAVDPANVAITGGTISGAAISGGSVAPVNLLFNATAPTISSGFGGTPSVSASNGPAAFRVNVGTGGAATSGVIGLPAATTGWNCSCSDITTSSTTVFLCKQTASSTTTATIGNFNTAGAAAAWVASDIVAVTCAAL